MLKTKINAKPSIEKENQLHNILNTAIEGIITINKDGIIDLLNPTAEKIFGYKQQDLIGKSVKTIIPLNNYKNQDSFFHNYVHPKTKNNYKENDFEIIAKKKDGTIIPINISMSRINLGSKLLAVGIIRDISKQKEIENQIKELSRRIITIQEEERTRIAKDMHDDLGQSLSALKIMCTSLFSKCKRLEKNHDAARQKALNYIDEMIERTRELSHSLSPIGLKNLGLSIAIRRLIENFNSSKHFKIKLNIDNIDSYFNEGWDTNIYRIVQEALTNITKHANANKISINTKYSKSKLILTVKDNGRGFSINKNNNFCKTNGIGLMIMLERAHLAGVELFINSEIGSGTEVKVVIPKKES